MLKQMIMKKYMAQLEELVAKGATKKGLIKVVSAQFDLPEEYVTKLLELYSKAKD